MDNDIHRYDLQLKSIIRNIENAEISEENKKLLLGFERAMLLLENLGTPRRLKLLSVSFFLIRKYFKKNIRDVTSDDIKDCLSKIESKNYSPWTVSGFKVVIKKLFKWLAYGDEETTKEDYPSIVSWIKIHVKKKNQPKIQASDILSEDEVHSLIAASDYSRDRAFISVLYELGARISEVGNLRIKDLTRDEHGYIIDLSGKTGHRTPRIVMSDSYLTEWIDHHPDNNNGEAPLWIYRDNGKYKKMLYNALRALISRLKKKAGITKRVYPHLFRHSRVTHLLAKGLLNEAQAKVFFGWTPDSGMLSEYAHLMSKDVNDTILQIYGVKPKENVDKYKTQECPRCEKVNPCEAKYCFKCGSVLNSRVAFEEEEETKKTDDILNMLLKDPEVQKKLMAKLAGRI